MATKNIIKNAKPAVEVKTIDQIKSDLIAAQIHLTDTKRGHRLGELTNPRIIGVTRKTIARLQTAIRADEIAKSKENK